MVTRNFKRNIRVTCWRETIPKDATKFQVSRYPDSIEITDLRVQFTVKKDHSKHPNSCDITITNLAERTRANLETKPLLVQLEAGYDDVYRFMYSGDLRFGMTKLDGPNWETLLQLGDGDNHYRWSRMNKSYGSGSSVRQILTDAAGSMGMELPANIKNDPALDAKFNYGRVASGPVRDKLTQLLYPYGYTWSIQNGKLRILREDQVHTGTPYPIDEEHGMIGTPEFGSPPKSGKPPHMTVKMLLYPDINPGDSVEVTSKVKSGLFKVETVTHTGDTHGEAWNTELEIKPIPKKATSRGSKTVTEENIRAFAGASASATGGAEI